MPLIPAPVTRAITHQSLRRLITTTRLRPSALLPGAANSPTTGEPKWGRDQAWRGEQREPGGSGRETPRKNLNWSLETREINLVETDQRVMYLFEQNREMCGACQESRERSLPARPCALPQPPRDPKVPLFRLSSPFLGRRDSEACRLASVPVSGPDFSSSLKYSQGLNFLMIN